MLSPPRPFYPRLSEVARVGRFRPGRPSPAPDGQVPMCELGGPGEKQATDNRRESLGRGGFALQGGELLLLFPHQPPQLLGVAPKSVFL